MKRTSIHYLRSALAVSILALAAIPAAFAQSGLNDFTAAVVADKELNSTAVGGSFIPGSAINPLTDSVTLAVGSYSQTFLPGTFKLDRFGGGYTAVVVTSSTQKIAMLLQPLKDGRWVYSAGIQGTVPSGNPVTVTLSVGSQAGSANVTAFIF
jgi:hypothetical protein